MKTQIIALILIAVLTCIDAAESASSSLPPIGRILTVGALLPLHGENGNYGISAQIALQIAQEDINRLFSNLGRAIRVHVVAIDTQSDPDITLKVLIALARRDLWADGMLSATRSEFEEEDRIMQKAVRYDPQTTDFSSQLNLLHLAFVTK